ncbi:MAG TPA: hydroxyisourate hydrolase [Thermoanaerobaculia bacterium]|nr:hydroxyisourate hydrolase [Thermoanaerobaculia bacterium]
MSGITTHVLDTSRGRPAGGVLVVLEFQEKDGWREIVRAETDADGRVRQLLPAGSPFVAGTWRLTFDVGKYFATHGVEAFYPEASIVFVVRDTEQHYHVPLLLSPYGYSTYRGS